MPPSSTASKPIPKKPARTVHIDVYCTGSDAEDDSSNDSNSLREPNMLELESNSTPQTVFDSNQLKLNHTRKIDKHDMPRRIGGSQQQQQQYLNENLQNASISNLREYLLAQSDLKDEVTESKQILFDKHVGDINGNDQSGQTFPRSSRFANSRTRFNFLRDQSDDCISSNYPNSSRSTVRDFTCSSISSVMAPSAVNDELESSWKETDVDASVKGSSACPSETFDFESRHDRWRARQWRLPGSSIMHDSIEEKDILETSPPNVTSELPSNFTNTTYQSIATIAPQPIRTIAINNNNNQLDVQPREQFYRGVSLERPDPATVYHQQAMVRPTRRFFFAEDAYNHNDAKKSPVQKHIPGYTREHLLRAQKFGSVIESIRKPGHHVGPAKNPDCQCEHCRRFFAERDNFRERASSLDITFTSRGSSNWNRRYMTSSSYDQNYFD